MPDDIAARMNPENWQEDWRVMSLPGRLDLQRSLIRDYKRHVDRFEEIAAYLKARQPPALLLWGRHDPYYQLDEIVAYARELERVEMHVFDGAHLLLETHYRECAEAIQSFIENNAKDVASISAVEVT